MGGVAHKPGGLMKGAKVRIATGKLKGGRGAESSPKARLRKIRRRNG